jgi:hypothetical protein
MLFLNMGSRFLMADLGAFNEKILSQNLVKKFILFCLFFVATRDIITSLLLTIAFSVIIYGLFNDKSKYSLVPSDPLIKDKMVSYYERLQKP